MKPIHLAYDLPKETITVIMMFYSNLKDKIDLTKENEFTLKKAKSRR